MSWKGLIGSVPLTATSETIFAGAKSLAPWRDQESLNSRNQQSQGLTNYYSAASAVGDVAP